jgi:hypothetical protein
LDQRRHKRIAFGGDPAADVLHSRDSVITGHSDRSEDISEQPGILDGDTGPYHVQPLLLSLSKRAIGNGAPKFFARLQNNATRAQTILSTVRGINYLVGSFPNAPGMVEFHSCERVIKLFSANDLSYYQDMPNRSHISKPHQDTNA